MAKIPFGKLNLKRNDSVSIIKWGDEENPIEIEVKNYLPLEERLEMIAEIVNDSVDENGYYNPSKIYIYTILHTIIHYTNISFTDKQKEDPAKLYDLLASSGLSGKIISEIQYEYKQTANWIVEIIRSIYEYNNSAVGILNTIKQDYTDAGGEVEDIMKQLGSEENVGFLRELLAKMGPPEQKPQD